MTQEKKDLWEELLLTSPTNDELCRIIISVPDLVEEAWSKLLVQRPRTEDLLFIMDHAGPDFTERAWRFFRRKIIARLVDHSALRRITTFPPAHRAEVAALILKDNPNSDDLQVIENCFPDLREEAKKHRAKRGKASKIISEMLKR